MHKVVKLWLAVTLLVLAVCASASTTITGKVVDVHDGDTLKLMSKGQTITIRMYGIDAPELAQPYGPEAQKYASSLALGKTVSVEVIKQEVWGRYLGVVTCPGAVNLNQSMVKSGLAWWYREYAKTSVQLPKLEAEAKNAKVGLWKDSGAVAPWNYRKDKKASAEAKAEEAKPEVKYPPTANSSIVYITASGKCYHLANCKTVRSTPTAITLTEATRRGLKACEQCKP